VGGLGHAQACGSRSFGHRCTRLRHCFVHFKVSVIRVSFDGNWAVERDAFEMKKRSLCSAPNRTGSGQVGRIALIQKKRRRAMKGTLDVKLDNSV
jgi:hypothetical protein